MQRVPAALLRRLVDGADHSFDAQRDLWVELVPAVQPAAPLAPRLPPELKESVHYLWVLEGDGVAVAPGLPVQCHRARLALGAEAGAAVRLDFAADVSQWGELALAGPSG